MWNASGDISNSPEAINEKTGVVVNQGEINLLLPAVEYVANNKSAYTNACRDRAVEHFNKQDRFEDYVNLFNSLIKK